MNLLGRYGSDDEDTERPAKKDKTVFADLSEDDREIGSRTTPAKLLRQLEVQHSGALPEGRRLDRILHLL